MRLGRVAVVGGGPGGLYAARLLKLAHPGAEVVVHERGAADETFGFGVGIAPATQRNLAEADAPTFEDILAASHPHDMSLQIGGRTVVARGELRAIGRTTLLGVLQRHADAAGVRLHFGSRARAEDLDADLVIGADGVSSATREALSSELGAEIETSKTLYLWCGTEFALARALFAPVQTKLGTFVTHAYPYAPDRSTFLVETDEATWRRAGFDKTSEALPEGSSDEASLSYLERAFADQLGGRRLIGNRTRWLRFRTVRCARWHHGNVVLLGDAVHTAHYSIGSGTKLAMEDAIALRQAIAAASTLEEALTAYTAARRAPTAHLQELARISEAWWDSFPERLSMPIEQVFVSYMTRTGKVPLERFAAQSPDVVYPALASFAGGNAPPPDTDLVAWTLAQPLSSSRSRESRESRGSRGTSPQWLGGVAGRVVDRSARAGFTQLDVAEGASTEEEQEGLVRRALELASVGAHGVWLSGRGDRDGVLRRLELAERVKRVAEGLVVVEAPASFKDDLAAALVAGRADLVCFEDA